MSGHNVTYLYILATHIMRPLFWLSTSRAEDDRETERVSSTEQRQRKVTGYAVGYSVNYSRKINHCVALMLDLEVWTPDRRDKWWVTLCSRAADGLWPGMDESATSWSNETEGAESAWLLHMSKFLSLETGSVAKTTSTTKNNEIIWLRTYIAPLYYCWRYQY